MIAAFDAHYSEDGSASAAAVLFFDYADSAPAAVFTKSLTAGAANYVPGAFYRRELPCILMLLAEINQTLTEMIVDGYVTLGNRAGLGKHLFDHLDGKIPVIGVAKSKYEESTGTDVYRGGSNRPLYITAAGLRQKTAAEKIRMMHGPHRVPTLLKLVDLLARGNLQSDT